MRKSIRYYMYKDIVHSSKQTITPLPLICYLENDMQEKETTTINRCEWKFVSTVSR